MSEKEYIICVDDEYIVLQSLKHELRSDQFFDDYDIEIMDSAQSALALIEDILSEGGKIAVIISDQRMPGTNGDELLLRIHSKTPDSLKILLTGFSDLEAVVRLVNSDVLYRYLSKPWDRHDILLTVREACRNYRQKNIIREQAVKIENLTLAMVTALESTNLFFDEETGNHILRIARVSEFIGHHCGCDTDFIRLLKLYSPLHDIGKVCVGKDILLKPGSLTAPEFELIKQHVRVGYDIINRPGIDQMAKNIVLYHHEKWNGKGYIHGLAGEDIPLESRIVSLADVFDALVSVRIYKPAYTIEEAEEILRSESGVSFDPLLLEAFLHAMHTDATLSLLYDMESRAQV